MSILAMLVFGGNRVVQTFTQTFTANGTWPCPSGVSIADISGYGARGQNAQDPVAFYYEVQTTYGIRRSDGARILVNTRDPEFKVGNSPAGYCTAPVAAPSNDPVYSQYYQCYAYQGQSTTPAQPATRGASATGLGKVFPGSLGNVPQTTTAFTDVPVTPSTNYSIGVPAGGTITITWRK